MGKATQDLRKEHDAILYVLQILDKMMQPDNSRPEILLQYYDELVYFFKIFVDKCHHGKEEDFLFKELVKKGISNDGGPIGVMLHEHAQGREYIAQMSRSINEKSIEGFNNAAVLYCNLLRRHIQKENNVLFMMADKVIDEKEQNLLFEYFEEHEKYVVGHGVYEKLHTMIDNWAQAFGVK